MEGAAGDAESFQIQRKYQSHRRPLYLLQLTQPHFVCGWCSPFVSQHKLETVRSWMSHAAQLFESWTAQLTSSVSERNHCKNSGDYSGDLMLEFCVCAPLIKLHCTGLGTGGEREFG